MVGTLDGKVAIVTGSSSGIGKATAERLAQNGASVVVNYARKADAAEKVVADIQAHGGNATGIQADLSQLKDVRRLFEQAMDRFGQLDILVANAGIAIYKPLLEATEADFDKTYALNAKGTFFCLQEAVRRMADGGRIVCVSTAATVLGAPYGSFYAGSKAAVEQFCRSLAKEIAPRGITVNIVSSGFTDTETLAKAGEEYKEIGAQMSPFKRLGQPEEIADAIAFLVSEQARWITGANIQAGGGVV